jgi:hypothetical protein
LPRATSALFSVCGNGLLGKEAKILLWKLSAIMLAEKSEKPYSEVCGYVIARIWPIIEVNFIRQQ